MLRASELGYDLPLGAIATRPAEPRDSARLMVVSRSDEGRVEHRAIRDLPALLQRGDLMVFNTTRVLPARLEGERSDTGGRVEGLFLGRVGEGPPERWAVLLRGRRLREGVVVGLRGNGGQALGALRLVEKHPEEPGGWIAEVIGDVPGSSVALDAVGRTPLPPYILKARRQAGVAREDSADRAWYQTVFAGEEGSVAAPTAGLHFTPELLGALGQAGIARADVVLHVGTGTFRPVEAEFVEQHQMHAEWCRVSPETVGALEQVKKSNGRVVAVGSTSARVLESLAGMDDAGRSKASGFETRLLITPGFNWRVVDGLLTNFHLPRSTLLAMVAALFPGGAPRVRALYKQAIEHGYRFYSYGDAMLILP